MYYFYKEFKGVNQMCRWPYQAKTVNYGCFSQFRRKKRSDQDEFNLQYSPGSREDKWRVLHVHVIPITISLN